MTGIGRFAELVMATAAEETPVSPEGEKKSFEELFSMALKDALDRVNGGSADSYDLGPWTVSNLILLADIEGYELKETVDFLKSILD